MTATTHSPFQVRFDGDLTNLAQSITLSSPEGLPGPPRGPGRPRTYPLTDGKKPIAIRSLPGVRSAAYYRGFPGGVPQARKVHAARAWEPVSAKKAEAFFPGLDPGFLENKFRWGAFKAFALSRGGPVAEITYPVAAANGLRWLVERNYAKLEGGKFTLRKKGQDLYNTLFKGRGPRDFVKG